MIFPIVPEISVYCVFEGMRCVRFFNQTATLGGPASISGFEWGLCPTLPSSKFTLNPFLSLLPSSAGDSSLAPYSLLLRVGSTASG